MKELSIPIDPAGRIVLPKRVREELAVRPGDTFKVSISGSAVVLTPEKTTAGFVRKGRALVFCAPGHETVSTEEINEILDATREERIASALKATRRS
jgi:AbrB family looped-hinge helix DNA binding protein